MTPRQRVLSALNHHSPDKVPYAAICGGLNPPAAEALAAFLHKDVAAVYRLFYEPFDIRGVGPAYIGPPERNTSRPRRRGRRHFGALRAKTYATGRAHIPKYAIIRSPAQGMSASLTIIPGLRPTGSTTALSPRRSKRYAGRAITR